MDGMKYIEYTDEVQAALQNGRPVAEYKRIKRKENSMKMKQRMIQLLLGMVMSLLLLPITATKQAVAYVPPTIWVNGTPITEKNTEVKCGTGTATYDFDSQTLTLDGAQLKNWTNGNAIYSDANLTIEVLNDSYIELEGSSKTTGIRVEGGELTIHSAEGAILSIQGVETGIYASKVTVDMDGELHIKSSNHAIHAVGDIGDGDILIGHTGALWIEAGGNGLYAPAGGVEIANGDVVYIEAVDYGIYSQDATVLRGSQKVKIYSLDDAIHARSSVKISADAKVELESGMTAIYAVGLVGSRVTFDGQGDVAIIGDDYGISATGNVTFSGSGNVDISSGLDGIHMTRTRAKVELSGNEKILSIHAGMRKSTCKAIFNTVDNTSPVSGTNYAEYTVSGLPSGNSVLYTWNTKKEYNIWINNEQFTSEKLSIACGAQGKATLDNTTTPYTLTLDSVYVNKECVDVENSPAIFIGSDVCDGIRIVLVGENTISVDDGYGIWYQRGTATFSGDGTLNLDSNLAGIYGDNGPVFAGDVTVNVVSTESDAIKYNAKNWDLKGAGKVSLHGVKGKAIGSIRLEPASGVSEYNVAGSPDSTRVVYLKKTRGTPVTKLTMEGMPTPVIGQYCSTADYDKKIKITTEPADVIEKVTYTWRMDSGYSSWVVSELEKFSDRVYMGTTSDTQYYLYYEITLKEGYEFANVLNIYGRPSFMGEFTVDGEKGGGSFFEDSMYAYTSRCIAETPAGHYGIWVNGEEFTSKNAKTGIVCGAGKATLNTTTNPYTLTLENAEITKAHGASVYSNDRPIKVVLKGKNTMSGEELRFYTPGNGLTISGTGSLVATGSDPKNGCIKAQKVVFDNAGTISISDMDIDSDYKTCISADEVFFAGSGKVNVNAHADYAIRSQGSIFFTGTGEVSLAADKTPIYMYQSSNAKVFLNGYNFVISLTSNSEFDSLVYGTVAGANLDKYTLEGELRSKSAVYRLTDDDRLPFTDVTYGTWQYNTVKFIYDAKIMQGTSATTFSPDKFMTRAQFIVVLWHMEGNPKVTFEKPFSDVPKSYFAATAIQWAKNVGLANGYSDGTFKPTETITREQFCAFLRNYAKYLNLDISTHGTTYTECPDGDQVSKTFRSSIQWAYERGFIGANGKLDPKSEIKRIHAATMLERFINYYLCG